MLGLLGSQILVAPGFAEVEIAGPALTKNVPVSEVAPFWEPVKQGVWDALDSLQAGAAQYPSSRSPVQVEPRSIAFRDYLRAGSVLCLVLALIVTGGVVLRRFGKHSRLLSGAHLASVLGKVYLTPRTCLYFVRTGGKVLVVGVTQNAISCLAEFDASAFESAGVAGKPEGSEFLTQLKTGIRKLVKTEAADAEEAEIASLRGDIERLQKFLRDGSDESRG
jgi:flagellar biogenesis protein FliO